MNHNEIVEFIRKRMEENVRSLLSESGQRVNPSLRLAAERQALAYWYTMQSVAEKITETEVRLALPECESPAGRRFTIEGVVDIIRDDGELEIFDIKSMPASYVRNNKPKFQEQLNVYAHILSNLKGVRVRRAAIIATGPEEPIRRELRRIDIPAGELEAILMRLNPLVEMELCGESIAQTIERFGRVVDRIESGDFEPPSPADLRKTDGRNPEARQFGVDVCRNCDVRFSCDSYRKYRKVSTRGAKGRSKDRNIWEFFLDCGDDEELSDELDANTVAAPEDGYRLRKTSPAKKRGTGSAS